MSNQQTIYSPDGLTAEQLHHVAPSIFAEHASEDRSIRYTFLPTIRVVERMEREGFFPVFAGQSRARLEGKREFARHMVRFRHKSHASMLQVGDILPEIVLSNSHDGTSSYEISSGLFRLACLNGLVIPTGGKMGLRVRHSGDIAEQVIEASYRVIHEAPAIVDKAREWQGIQLQPAQIAAYNHAAALLRWDSLEESPLSSATALDVAHRYQDAGNDLWKTFNRTQENLIRGGILRRQTRYENGRRKGLRGVNSITENMRINKALWTLTEALAGHATGKSPLVVNA